MWVSKNAEFYADFKCVEMAWKTFLLKFTGKKYTKKALNPENSNLAKLIMVFAQNFWKKHFISPISTDLESA